MKKIIGLIVLMLGSLSALQAQSKTEPTPAIASAFEKQFKNATDVDWSKTGNAMVVRFKIQQAILVAYYNSDGGLIAKGRKIKEENLPMAVQEELLKAKLAGERKSGTLIAGGIYEFSRQPGDTEYLATLKNDQVSMTLHFSDGQVRIQKKKVDTSFDGTPSLIAKRPN